MGNGLTPGPTDDLGPSIVIDDGTGPRTESPQPGPIGLDARGSTPKQSQPSIAERILSFSSRRRGQRVGDGECFALADGALRSANAKSAEDFGTVVPDADYIWGAQVELSGVQPGDVIQFRDYRFDREVETRRSDGSTSTQTDFQERPHHTAIVESVGSNGEITVLEQNSPRGSAVARTQLFFANREVSGEGRRTVITVQGMVRFYRPQAR